jgi:hypothetical protein
MRSALISRRSSRSVAVFTTVLRNRMISLLHEGRGPRGGGEEKMRERNEEYHKPFKCEAGSIGMKSIVDKTLESNSFPCD